VIRLFGFFFIIGVMNFASLDAELLEMTERADTEERLTG
jgi:hypothetical protein